MKFWKALGLAGLLSAVPVSAALFDGLSSGLDYAFSFGASNINILRLLMAVVIIAVLYSGLEKAFRGNKGAAIVVSVVIAIIGVRFMPAELLLKLAAFIWVLLFLAVPYLLIGRVVDNVWVKVLGSVAAALVLLYLLRGYIGFGFDLGFVEGIYYLVADNLGIAYGGWVLAVAIVAVVIIVALFLLKKKKVE